MALRDNVYTEVPLLLSVLDAGGVDRLLVKLMKVHGASGPRYDLAPELAATRATARRAESAAERVPAS